MGPWTEPCVVLTFQKKKKKIEADQLKERGNEKAER